MPVPPVAAVIARPLFPPLQLTFVCDVVSEMAAGCVIVTVAVFVHVFASVTVTI